MATFRRKTALSLSVAYLLASAQAVKLPSDILACRDVPSATERLDCYDSIVDHRQNIPATPAVSQEDLFGKSGDEIQRAVERAPGSGHIDRLYGQVTGLRSSSSGLVVIALDNGQVWRQIDAPKLRIAEGDNVLIRRASLGSYMMQKVGSKRSMRVKRTS